jgi:hypothetical protein
MVDEIVIRFSVKDDGSPTIDRVNKKLGETKEQSKALVPGLEKARRGLTDFASANAGLLAALTASAVAIQQMYKAAREGAALEYSKEKFDRLAQSIGTTADALMGELQVATKGTLSNFEAMALASDLLSLGLAKNSDEAVRLATVQSGLGMDLNQLVLTLTNQTTMRFDALGVSVDGFKERVAELEEQGYSANDAFQEAFLQQAEKQLLRVGNAADSTIGTFKRFEAATKDLGDEFKMAMAEGLEPYVKSMVDAMDAGEKMVKVQQSARKVLGLTDDQLRRARQSSREFNAQYENLVNEFERGAALTDLANKQLAGMGVTLEDVAVVAEATAMEFDKMIGLINNIQSAEENFTEKSEDLADKRLKAEEKLATFRAQGYWEQSSQIQGALEDLEEIKQSEQELADERAKQTLQFISDILAEQLARDGWTQTEFEAFAKQQEAWGLWSADVVEKAQAAWLEADKITQSISAIPTQRDINFNFSTSGVDPQTLPGGYAYQYANQSKSTPHAGGGSFTIPFGGGNESFMMPGGNTASGGETVTITQANRESRTDALLQELINKKMVDENRLARAFLTGLQSVGQ